MSNRLALLAIPRHAGVVYRDLEAQRQILDMYRNLATEFYALDLRPRVFDEAMHQIDVIGPDPVPANLREMLTQAAQRYAELEQELVSARQYYFARRDIS